jgi:hypothetical protein
LARSLKVTAFTESNGQGLFFLGFKTRNFADGCKIVVQRAKAGI